MVAGGLKYEMLELAATILGRATMSLEAPGNRAEDLEAIRQSALRLMALLAVEDVEQACQSP